MRAGIIPLIIIAFIGCALPGFAFAQSAAVDSGSTAWMLVSTLLVLMMIIPGLALFYGGMVHKESVLATLMQSFTTCCLISVLWAIYGYSFVFTEGNQFVGGAAQLFLRALTPDSVTGAAPAIIPESVFFTFQLTFAAITCALLLGSVANRIKFSSALIFMSAWFTLVYIPVAHWVWGPKGLLGAHDNGILGFGPTLDFAGGTVVHINAGIAGLVSALVLGAHKNFGKPDYAPPYNVVFSVIGASLLWVGWFGFNAGSAAAANASAGMAMLNTHIAAAMGSLTWMAVEWVSRGKPSVIGIISGAVSGLVAITPAGGFVDVRGAFAIGIAAGIFCFWGCQIKYMLKFDDSLDVFGVHCIGGIVGALLTGLFAVEAVGGHAASFRQLLAQAEGVIVTVVYCGIMSFIILKIIDIVIGLRVDEETEETGLDMAIHGERLH